MAKINPCFKKTFIFFNALFAIFGIVIFALAVIGQQFAEEEHGKSGVIVLYVAGTLMFLFSVLGVYGAYKESKWALIVFFSIMCLATGGMLRVAIPLATQRAQLRSEVQYYLQSSSAMTTDMKHALNSIQPHLKCCGLGHGYQDWQGDVPASCNCDNSYSSECKTVNIKKDIWYKSESETRKVWSKPCGNLFVEYFDKIMNFSLGLLFTFAVLAILGGLMSLMMIITISSPTVSQMPGFPLSYQPPKYSEVVGY
ncbi:hypothetical protein KOW79_015989 [Hemibagrus wyckioides]|uniref:Tetraspanin n=1 Tax=Hemibagrus wyckioides TaxID=337641 RepID=A0A9D3SD88_9TELE|nr:tetraspanin-8-like [Hemibagrus wyckioides]KAG7320136.1 hypothetical protein KOW79_015989 [Hemibagrus wyckioides]